MYAEATVNMVQNQLAPNGIRNDRVMNAFMAHDRAAYVPPHLRAASGCDETVLGEGGAVALLRPLTLALMVQHLADWRDNGKVAVLGDENGYVRDILVTLGFDVVAIVDEHGLQQNAPFDAILINGAIAEAPAYLKPFLTAEGCVLAVIQPTGALGEVSAVYADETLPLGQTACPYFAAFRPDEAFAL